MKYAWLLCLAFLTGCAQPVNQPSGSDAIVSTQEGPGTAASYSTESRGESMAVIRWEVKIQNTASRDALQLVIDCLDEKGNIIAEDHKLVLVAPGGVLFDSGKMDVPVGVLGALSKMRARLLLER